MFDGLSKKQGEIHTGNHQYEIETFDLSLSSVLLVESADQNDDDDQADFVLEAEASLFGFSDEFR